jgi:hypothetical protein
LAIATTPFKEILHEILYQIHEISQAREEDNCEFRIANFGFKTKETGVRRSSKLKGGIVEAVRLVN